MDPTIAMNAVSEVEVPVSVKLAETELSLADLLALRPGSTLAFPSSVDDSLTLEVNGIEVGSGHAVERHGQLGFVLQNPASSITSDPWLSGN